MRYTDLEGVQPYLTVECLSQDHCFLFSLTFFFLSFLMHATKRARPPPLDADTTTPRPDLPYNPGHLAFLSFLLSFCIDVVSIKICTVFRIGRICFPRAFLSLSRAPDCPRQGAIGIRSRAHSRRKGHPWCGVSLPLKFC